jgi:hypothetical protein
MRLSIALVVSAILAATAAAEERDFTKLPTNTWVKLSPLKETPPSPRLGYEGACVWDAKHERMIRYGGHNQGGGGEQGSEIWSFDPKTAVWKLHEPNISPPGICCGQQNVFDPIANRYIRFPAFSNSHGWQWLREVYLNNASVWTYDLETNTWRNMRPYPTAHPSPLRCASWDSEHQVVVMFGGEGNHEGTQVYDPYLNTWTKKSPKPQPEFRSGGNMAYDPIAKKHVLFGSQFDNDQHTWTYDLNTNEWKDMQPAAMPPTDKNDAVLTYDGVSGEVLAIIKVTTGKDDDESHRLETWSYSVAKNAWTKRNPEREPDPTASRARQLMFAPQLGVCLLENRPSNTKGPAEQQIWAWKSEGSTKPYAAPQPKPRKEPPLVQDVTVSVRDATHVDISWPASKSKDVSGYVIERAVVEVLTDDQLKRVKAQTPVLESPSVAAIRRVGKFERITDKPVREAKYTDSSIDLRKPQAISGEPLDERKFSEKEDLDADGRVYRFAVYAYRVRAVNNAGGESGPSAAIFTIPAPPQFVFSKEEGDKCHLKWQASNDANIKGYRVYRLDGRWAKDPVSRLTPDAITATTFTDESAGKASRRYHVVAVDALGQEGFPSSPAWANRQWQPFYVPFVGEWHQ